MTHRLKTLPSFFGAIVSGDKTFEIRKNDRGFQRGDWLLLEEWTGAAYTGRKHDCRVTYITDYKQQSGFVVMGIAAVTPAPVNKSVAGAAINEAVEFILNVCNVPRTDRDKVICYDPLTQRQRVKNIIETLYNLNGALDRPLQQLNESADRARERVSKMSLSEKQQLEEAVRARIEGRKPDSASASDKHERIADEVAYEAALALWGDATHIKAGSLKDFILMALQRASASADETADRSAGKFSHCVMHNTYPADDEPCWQCVNKFAAATPSGLRDVASAKSGGGHSASLKPLARYEEDEIERIIESAIERDRFERRDVLGWEQGYKCAKAELADDMRELTKLRTGHSLPASEQGADLRKQLVESNGVLKVLVNFGGISDKEKATICEVIDRNTAALSQRPTPATEGKE